MVVLTFLLTMLAAADPRPPFTSPKSPRPEYARGLKPEEARAGWINLYDAIPAPLGWPGSGFIQTGQLTFLMDGATASEFGDYELRIDAAAAGDLVVGGRRKVIRVPVGTSTHRVEGLGRGPIRLGEGLAISSLSIRPLSLRPLLGRGPDGAPAWKQVGHPSLPLERQAKWEELADPAGLRAVGGPGAVELGGEYGDFVLQVEVTTRRPLANGGVFFRCKAGEFLNGYEAQVFNGCYDHDPAKPAQWATGAIDDRQNAVRLVSRDGQPFTMTIVAAGPHVATWVNGVQVTDWTDRRDPHDNPRPGASGEGGADPAPGARRGHGRRVPQPPRRPAAMTGGRYTMPAATPMQPGSRPMHRREFLWRCGGGLGGVALAQMLGRQGLLAAPATSGPQFPARAKRVVQLFMSGAASQCDTFDYKPRLVRDNGRKWDPGEKVELFQSDPGQTMQSPWGWKRYGRCGKWVSDLVPHIGQCVDDIAFIHSMVATSNVHGPATFMQNTGFVLPGFPSMGAWVSYGLGSLADNLPTFVVLPDVRGFAPNGPANWGSAFLPAVHQGTMIRVGRPNPINDLFPPGSAKFITRDSERDGLAVLEKLNRQHRATREGDSRLDARIASYEMAARLQLSAPEVLDISGESEATKRLYGLDKPVTEDFGRRCLTARRLLERGVRFVQVWSGADNGFPRRNWDSHEDIAKDHGDMAAGMDQPAAALLKDLKQRGMLEDTVVVWTTEFGRMPCSQGSKGRDHNPFTFTSWLAGGGIRGGVSYGESDEWSYKAVKDPTQCYDLHATVLHLLGIDHTKLTFRHNGIDRRLTDVHGHVVREILA